MENGRQGGTMPESEDEQQILALHLDGDKALISADVEALAWIFADDYVQYNESGRAFTKQDVLNNFGGSAFSATWRWCTDRSLMRSR
jgi:hypothetical protein